ncbi:MAG: dephospho-CoA kinase, partial [Phycisphaerales bacterium]|nr:dephospho-CoA kinase [Phycisphaerales bacterium]
WGPGVLGEGGRIERAKVASIIFADASERVRLEALVHPIVRQERAAMIREAREARAAGVIVDAPLLFEAGVDAECDAVVFVDAPPAVRLARVQSSRGWTTEELERRERAQMSLDEKRARCRYVIDNGGAEGVNGQRPLAEQAREVLDDARSRWAAPGVVVDG